MATLIEVETGQQGYKEIVHHVLNSGRSRAPRGMATLDMGPTMIKLRSPHGALPMGTGRNLNPKIAVVEALQLIAGFSDPALMLFASQNFSRWIEHDGTFYGAYGKRIGNQLQAVVQKLRDDPDSRQAVITLWDPSLDNMPHKKDYPCTVSLAFAIVDDKLNMNTLMRSNDVWLGLPYDLFQFTQLQLTLARVLAVEAGEYTHVTWSLHIYEEHIDAAYMIKEPTTFKFQPSGLGVEGNDLATLHRRIRGLAYGLTPDLTESEQWYAEQLAGFTIHSPHMG